MLDAQDKQTLFAIRSLIKEVKEKRKMLFWVGAGCSAWNNYPLWQELTEKMHSDFLKYEPNYNKDSAINYLSSQCFPDFFSLCKDINEKRYNSFLVEIFSPRPSTPVYERFINSLSSINPTQLITSNIDECLENNIRNITVIQRTDIERCIDLLNKKVSFICKLHGSISSIKSVVFDSRDYANLSQNTQYLSVLKHLFLSASVVFIGFGLGEDYILKLLIESAGIEKIFGNGPHYAILPKIIDNLPHNTNIIKYIPQPHKDHCTPLQILDEIIMAQKPNIVFTNDIQTKEDRNEIISAHLLSDITPPGTWDSSHTLELTGEDGRISSAIIGNGLTTDELPLTESTAMHDLIVGLLCFDFIYVTIPALSRVHTLLGSDLFWTIVRNNCLKFVDWKSQLGILYPNKHSQGGELFTFQLLDEQKKEIQLRDIINRHIKVVPGKEKEAEHLFSILESKISVINPSRETNILQIVSGLLLRPSIRKLIGMSEGVNINSIPRWMLFPVIRFANTVKLGIACRLLGIASTKLEFGSSILAGPAFAAASGEIISDEMASYVVCGKFNTNLGAIAIKNPQIILSILSFRDSQEGIELRKQILKLLAIDYSSDVVTAINAGLKSSIQPKYLQAAHDRLATMLIASGTNPESLTPSVWNDSNYAEKALKLWKKKSLAELILFCEQNKITDYSRCPCGSGEKLKFCCKEALNT